MYNNHLGMSVYKFIGVTYVTPMKSEATWTPLLNYPHIA